MEAQGQGGVWREPDPGSTPLWLTVAAGLLGGLRSEGPSSGAPSTPTSQLGLGVSLESALWSGSPKQPLHWGWEWGTGLRHSYWDLEATSSLLSSSPELAGETGQGENPGAW